MRSNMIRSAFKENYVYRTECIEITLTLRIVRIFDFQEQYIFRSGILVLCVRSARSVKGPAQHSHAYLKLHVTRSLFRYEARNCNIGLHKADREVGSGRGEDRCRNWCGMLRSYEAAGGSPLETFVPHKLDILPEDARYWTLLDVR